MRQTPLACYNEDMGNPVVEVEDYAALYQLAFEQFGIMALWNKRQIEDPTPADALVIARALRFEGNLDARRLAERIERACRATV